MRHRHYQLGLQLLYAAGHTGPDGSAAMALTLPEGSLKGANVTGIHHLELDVLDDPAVLLRVVSVCHQRRFPIAFLRYDRVAGGARLLLGVESGSMQLPRLEYWLANLIHVLAVRVRGGGEPRADGQPSVNMGASE
jgi:hypothetical protein